MEQKSLSIGVNAYEANVAKRVGSNQYAFRLLVELERVSRGKTIEWTVYLPSIPLFDLPKERPGFAYVVCPPKKLWSQWRLPLQLYLKNKHHDVFLSLGHYSPRFCPSPTVICILDLAFLKFPQFFLKKDLYQLKNWTAYSARNAQHIFTISQSSKKDILEVYKKQESEVSIAYPGLESVQALETMDPITQKILERFKLENRRYIVSIGTIQPRKNIVGAIHAFEKVNPEKGNIYKLVLVGKAGWLTDEFERIILNSPQKENIVLTGFVDDDEKQGLLQHAAASFLVGYYEGFGIPAIESLQAGVVPVVANTASLPEVVGEYGILIDPYSVDSIASGFTKALEMNVDALRRSQMLEWAKRFSWEESATNMLSILVDKFGKKQ
ncbi:MAG: glycosyltransferase family 1 protein [Candidatus Woesebacteria bacterium]